MDHSIQPPPHSRAVLATNQTAKCLRSRRNVYSENSIRTEQRIELYPLLHLCETVTVTASDETCHYIRLTPHQCPPYHASPTLWTSTHSFNLPTGKQYMLKGNYCEVHGDTASQVESCLEIGNVRMLVSTRQ